MVTRQDSDIIQAQLPGNVGRHNVAVRQLNLEHGIRQSLDNRSFEFDDIVLRQSNHPYL